MIYGVFKFHACFILWYLWLPKAVRFPAPLKAADMFQQQKPHISKIVFLVSLFYTLLFCKQILKLKTTSDIEHLMSRLYL